VEEWAEWKWEREEE
jgi:hypothetical protein